jgi:serine/threonine-protein kinase
MDGAMAESPLPAASPQSAASLDSPGADLTGRTLGEFEILRKLGAGGMGQVYLARQLSLKRQVALKLLRKDLANNETAMMRFQAEAEAVARLNHTNIVQVYGAGESDGLRYMALEFVDGRNLREHLARKGPPDLPIALSIMRQIATALQKAHELGLVHRDIKPENILVTKKVEVKVTDFGLSRFFNSPDAVSLTQSGVALGTPLYLSPEQAQGKPVDHRSDLYSFGVTSFHLLSGEPPFKGTTPVEVALKHITDAPPRLADLRPDLPADLCDLVHKLMSKRPEERYQSARDVLRDLNRVKDGRGLAAMPPKPQPTPALSLSTSQPLAISSGMTLALPPAPPVRWVRWAFAALGCTLAATLGVILYVLLHPKQPTTATNPTPRTVAGLPEIKSPEKPVSPRERELLAILKDRGTSPDHWISASIDLGLLLLNEGRLDEATARFDGMERETLPSAPNATQWAHFAGRLGKAVVMAHRDNDPQHPQAAQASVKLFGEALSSNVPLPIVTGKKNFDRWDAVRAFLARHPELAQACAEALNRDAANGAKLPVQLELLRSPRALRKE